MNTQNTQEWKVKPEYVPNWSVIGNKVYLDGDLFCKTSDWPNAMLIKRALENHQQLLCACKGVFALLAKPMSETHETIWALQNDPETIPEWRAMRDAITKAESL